MIHVEEYRTDYERNQGEWIERGTVFEPDALESFQRSTDPGAPEYWKSKGVLYRKRSKHKEDCYIVTVTLLKDKHKQKRRFVIK